MKTNGDIDINWLSPVQEHNGLLYKRDDLFSPFDNGVNGGKARQAISLIKNNLKHIQENCNSTIITATSITSPQGIIISTVANHFNLKSIVSFGYHWGFDRLLEKNPLVQKAQEVGGEIRIVSNASYTNVVESAVQEIVNKESYFPIKFGINAATNADSIFGVIENQVKNIPKDLDLLLIPVGSGLIFSGIIRGLLKYGNKPKRIVGILSGMDCFNAIESNLRNYPVSLKGSNDCFSDFLDEEVKLEYELYQSDTNYHKKIMIDEPFLIDPIYEAKSIRWYEQQIENGLINNMNKNLIWIVGNQRDMY